LGLARPGGLVFLERIGLADGLESPVGAFRGRSPLDRLGAIGATALCELFLSFAALASSIRRRGMSASPANQQQQRREKQRVASLRAPCPPPLAGPTLALPAPFVSSHFELELRRTLPVAHLWTL